GFGLSLAHQTSYGMRDQGKDWTGNSVYLWAVVNAVYMALLGPQGFRELGELILQRSHYAARQLAAIPGVRVAFPSGFFKELVVREAVGEAADRVPVGRRRAKPPALPELSEHEVLRHYLHLSQETQGMMGISLFGTCTMKYNPRVSEAIARRYLADLHPHQDEA